MHFYRKCWFDPFEEQFISSFLSDCLSLMLGIAIHCIQHYQAMLERGVCELAHSFFHYFNVGEFWRFETNKKRETTFLVENLKGTYGFTNLKKANWIAANASKSFNIIAYISDTQGAWIWTMSCNLISVDVVYRLHWQPLYQVVTI